MISQTHIPLSSLATEHFNGVEKWVSQRLLLVRKLVVTIKANSHLKNFPQKKLLKLNPGIHGRTFNKLLPPFKECYRDSSMLDDFLDIFDRLEGNLKICLSGTPLEIHDLTVDLEKIFSKYRPAGKNTYNVNFRPLIMVLNYVFDYSGEFSNPRKIGWNSYVLAEKLGINVCPYCNRLFTNTVKKKVSVSEKYPQGSRSLIRPEFDHFYLHSKFPYLAVSFYNLIPSCSSCNSSLKGQTEMSILTHSHPYLEGFEKEMAFHTDVDPKDWLLDTQAPMRIKFSVQVSSARTAEQARALANADTFELETIYNAHLDIAKEIFMKATQDSIAQLEAAFNFETPSGSRFFTTKQDFYRHYTGNYFEQEWFHLRPLSKFQNDLYRKSGLIELMEKLEGKITR